MALQLSNQTKNKCLDSVFKWANEDLSGTLTVMIPALDSEPPSTVLPNKVITFSEASNGQTELEVPVSLEVQSGTTIDAVYLHIEPLTKGDIDDALVKIVLTEDDEEYYENNGVYIINTINVAINT